MLARLALRSDRALWAGALGIAAAILLPVTGTLVLAGLSPNLDGAWVAYTTNGSDLRWQEAASPPDWVVARSDTHPHKVAYVTGPVQVKVGATLAMPEAAVGQGTPRSGATLDGLAPDDVLLHPNDLGASTPVLAGFKERTEVPGAHSAPSRGSDAFEADTTTALRGQSLALVLLSAPAVALLASALARQEVRALSRASATLVSLGGQRAAFWVLAGRLTVAVALAVLIAVATGYLLHVRGGVFDPPDDPELLLAFAVLAPAAVALVTGLVWAALATRRIDALRTGGPAGEDDVAWRIPARARPVLLGIRPLVLLLLAALLFMADVGFPLAAAKVPASLAGGDGEWVIGAPDGLHVGVGVGATAATVVGLDPRIDAVLAETVTPTIVEGRPAVVRGGEWDQLDEYHHLGRLSGEPPSGLEVVLGHRLARRMDAHAGDAVTVQNGDRADVMVLRVSGIVSAPGLLGDEAFVDERLGRRLADLAPGQANLVRVRPQTKAALDALTQVEPNLVVEALTIEPVDPVAGSIAYANVTVANLGSSAGQRTLTVRVADAPVGSVDAVVAGHARRSLRVPFVVPAGAWQVEVNPTTDGQASAAAAAWEVPAPVRAGQPFTARLVSNGAGVSGAAAALYRDLANASSDAAVQRGATDSDGKVTFTPASAGDWVVGTRAQGGAYATVSATQANATSLVVEAVWTEPATLELRKDNQLFGRVRNPGDAAVAEVLGAFAGGTRVNEREVTLGPGEAVVIWFTLYLLEPVDSVGIGNTTLQLGTQVATTAPPAPGPDADPALPTAPAPSLPQDASSGTAVQAQVADRALGDARAILVGLSASATATTLAVVALVTERTLAGRRHVVGLLQVLGFSADQVRQRAAFEGAVLGGAAALLVLLPAKVLFWLVGEFGPAVFAHGLPDPIGWLFALQATAAFAGVCAFAAYFGAARAAAKGT